MAEDQEMPPMFGKSGIPHYYGDSVRSMLISAAVVYALSLPIWGNLLPFDTSTGIGVVIVLVLLAGLVNPRSLMLMLVNAFVAGLGVFLLEAAAITLYKTDSVMLFFLRELCAILLLFGFYYSVRSARNMMAGKIGATASPDEFKQK
jgi:hypothetical protein